VEPLSVRHVDLAAAPLSVPRADPGHGVLLVLWAGDLPLGQVELRAEALHRPIHVLRERVVEAIAPAVGSRLLPQAFPARPPERRRSGPPVAAPPASRLGALRSPVGGLGQVAPPAGSASQVSVVVCTRDRPEQLRRALLSLAALSPRPAEVLVVDNAPATGATRDVVADAPGVHYISEPRPGLSAARNAGIRVAAAPYVAFTDDDVEVTPSWAGRLQQAFEGSAAAAVTGLVLPVALDTPGQLLFEQHLGGFGHDYAPLLFDEQWFAGMRAYGVPVWRIGAGANMAFRREVFDELGDFDERLGAGAAGCSEDSEMWYRVLASGAGCLYEPAAVVRHSHRPDVEGVRQQADAYLDGHVTALVVQAVRHRHLGNLRRLAVALPRYYVGRSLRAARRPDPTLVPELRGFARGLRRAPGLLLAGAPS